MNRRLEVRIDTSSASVGESVRAILAVLKTRGFHV
jgi:hypothetical protein